MAAPKYGGMSGPAPWLRASSERRGGWSRPLGARLTSREIAAIEAEALAVCGWVLARDCGRQRPFAAALAGMEFVARFEGR
jgi:hypothetical protein